MTTIAIRFMALTDTTGGPTACWWWRGADTGHATHPYGLMHDQARGRGGVRRATHVALELAGYPRPANLQALHHCDNTLCVNPQHLYWGTKEQNTADMTRRGRSNVGAANGQAKLTREQVDTMRHERTQGADLATLAERYGVGKSTVSRICRRESWV